MISCFFTMSHVTHIANNKGALEARAKIIRAIREFFWSRGFLEMETPHVVRLPGQEPNLSPMRVTMRDERGAAYEGYLHTSPEYTLKKMLAAGFEKIFSLGKVYRDEESFGGTHNPEFTMIEWYRAHEDFYAIMDDVEGLFQWIGNHVPACSMLQASSFMRMHMRDAWQRYAGVNLDDYLTRDAMLALCKQKGYAPKEDERYEELFYWIFLNEIEPYLGKDRPIILHHYPAPMAALSRISESDPSYAERFEVYAGGTEIANCFSELTDPAEQRRRLVAEREERRTLGKAVFDIDEEFLVAVQAMPPSAGIALGVDRLIMALTGCKNIDDVLSLPASKLF